MTTNRTPGPWSYNSYTEKPSERSGYFIYSPYNHREIAKLQISGEYKNDLSAEINQANAEFIVRACNAHDALVGALKDIVNAFGSQGHTLALRINGEHMNKVRSALRMAGEEV